MTVTRGKKRLMINHPKTKAGNQKILIDDGLISVMKSYKKKYGNIQTIGKEDLIFNREGSPYNPTLTKTWLLLLPRVETKK